MAKISQDQEILHDRFGIIYVFFTKEYNHIYIEFTAELHYAKGSSEL